MIPITDLNEKDVGRWVRYRANHGALEWGRLKTWNDKFIFVVYNWAAKQAAWMNYTAASTKPEQLEFDMNLPIEILREWNEKIRKMSYEDMAILHRYAPSEFEVFRNFDLWMFISHRFVEKGGMTNEMVKKLDEMPLEERKARLATLMERPLTSLTK